MKITLEEFFGIGRAAIHCNTEKKANRLLEAFDKIGKKWCDGKSYLNNDSCWNTYKENTCYGSHGTYGTKGCFHELNYELFDYEDIIFGKENKTETGNALKTIVERMNSTSNFEREYISYWWSDWHKKPSIRSVTLNEKKKITTVVFTDGDKRMVKCGEHDIYSPEMGITYCIALKAMDMSKTQYKKMIDKFVKKE